MASQFIDIEKQDQMRALTLIQELRELSPELKEKVCHAMFYQSPIDISTPSMDISSPTIPSIVPQGTVNMLEEKEASSLNHASNAISMYSTPTSDLGASPLLATSVNFRLEDEAHPRRRVSFAIPDTPEPGLPMPNSFSGSRRPITPPPGIPFPLTDPQPQSVASAYTPPTESINNISNSRYPSIRHPAIPVVDTRNSAVTEPSVERLSEIQTPLRASTPFSSQSPSLFYMPTPTNVQSPRLFSMPTPTNVQNSVIPTPPRLPSMPPSRFPFSYLQSSSPSHLRLSPFAGSVSIKGTVSYPQWRSEVKYLMKCAPEDLVMQSVRQSLRSPASESLLYLGEDVTLTQVMTKFDTLYGNVLPTEKVLETFYTSKQFPSESVVEWSNRLEALAYPIKTMYSHTDLQNMMRSKFWSGLYFDHIRYGTRHLYDSGTPYEALLLQARVIEQEPDVPPAPTHAFSQNVCTNDPSDTLADKLNSLQLKVDSLLKGRDRYKNVVCYRCNEKGHVQRFCKANLVKESGPQKNVTPSTDRDGR